MADLDVGQRVATAGPLADLAPEPVQERLASSAAFASIAARSASVGRYRSAAFGACQATGRGRSPQERQDPIARAARPDRLRMDLRIPSTWCDSSAKARSL